LELIDGNDKISWMWLPHLNTRCNIPGSILYVGRGKRWTWWLDLMILAVFSNLRFYDLIAITFIFVYFKVTPHSFISLTLRVILFIKNNAWKLAVIFCMSVLISSHMLRGCPHGKWRDFFPCLVILNCYNTQTGQKQKFPVFCRYWRALWPQGR